jgi:hypothetical protein
MDGVIGLSELLRYKDDYLSVLEKSFKYSGWNDVLKVDPKKNELLKKSDNPMSGDRYLNIKHDGCGYFRYEDGNKSIFTCDTIDGRWWCYESLSSLVDDKAEIDCLNVDVLSR